MTSRAVTRVRDRFARSKLEDCHLRPPILSPIPISATNLTVPFADVKDLNVVFRSIVEQECRLLCEIPLETILDACFLTYFRHIFLSFFHSSQKPYAELRNLDINSFHEKSFNPSRRVMETICSHLSTQQHEEYVIHVLYRLLKLNRELLQTDPKNKRKVSSKIYCEVSKTLASNGLEKSAVSLFIQNMYFSFASSTLVQLIKYCDDREIFESCIEFSGWTIAILYSLQRNQPQLRPTFEFVLGSLRQAPLLREQDIALHSLSLLEMLASPLFRYDVGWKGTETMARSEGATAFFADNDSDIEFAYINMLYFTVESAADLFAILCVSDLLFHSLTQDLHPRDRVKDLSTSSTFLLLARLSFIVQSEADLAACIVSGVVFHILFAFPTDSSALALKAEQFKTLKSLVCLLDLLGLDGTIWLDAAFKLDERMAHGVSTDKCPYSTTAALLLAMLHRSTFEAVSRWLEALLFRDPIRMSSLLLTTMRLAVLLKQILTSTDLLVVLVGQFIRLFQLKDERGQSLYASARDSLKCAFIVFESELNQHPLRMHQSIDFDSGGMKGECMEWIGGFDETLLSIEDESRAEEMVSMLRFKMAHPSGRAEIDECTRIVNRLCCFQSAVSSLLRPLLFREDDWWKPLTAESFSSEIQETLTVLACPLEVLFLGIESGSTVLLCVTPMRLRVMLLKGAAPDVNNVVKNNIILTFLSIHALRSKGRISITSLSDQIDAIVSFDSSILSALTVSQTHLITPALATALCHHLKLLVVSPSQNTLLYFLSSLELFMRSQDWAAYLPYLLHHHNWDFLLLNIHNPELCPILSFEWIAIALLSTGTSLLEHFKIDKSSSLTAILIILVHLIEHIQMPSIPSPYQQNIWIQRQRFLKDCHLFMQMDSSLLAKSTSNRIPLFQTAFSLESRTFFFLERASICRQFKVSWSLIEDKGIGYISNITVDSSANSDLTASKALMTTISLQTLTEVHSESTLQSLSNISLSTVIPSTLRRSLRWILCTEFNNDSEKLLAELLSMQRQGMGKGAHYQRCLLQMILHAVSMLPLSQSPKKSCYFALPVAESLLFLFFSLSKNDEKSHEMFELLLQDCFSSPDATKNMLIAGWFDPILLPPQLDTSHCLHRLGDFILNLILQKEVIVSTYKSSLVFSLYSLAYHACFVLMTPENGTDESSVASCFEALLPLLLDLKHDFWGILEIDEAFDSIYEVIPYCTTWSIPRMELLKQRCRAIQQGAREPRTLLSTSSYITKRPVQEGDLPKQASNKSTLMDIGNGYARATSALYGYISPASNTGQMPHARSSWIPKPKRKANQGGDDEEDLLPPTPAHYSGEENPPKTTIKVEVKIEDDVKIEEAVHKKFRIKF